MISKKDYLERLRKDPLFQRALKLATSDLERRRIIAITESVADKFFDAMTPLSSDPETLSKIREVTKEKFTVVKERDGTTETVASGSKES